MARPTIPSPDRALIEMADRIAAVPQRRGVPLPLALCPVGFVSPLGSLAMAVFLASVGFLGVAALVACAGGVEAAWEVSSARQRLRDARSWSPALARKYRQEADRARATWPAFRMAEVALLGVALGILALASSSGFPSAVTLAAGGYLAWVAGHAAKSYGACARPRDPDALQPAAGVA